MCWSPWPSLGCSITRAIFLTKWLKTWPWSLLFIWLKRLYMIPKNSWWGNGASTVLERDNPSIRSSYIHRPDAMRPGQEKGIGPAVAWPVLLHPRKPSAFWHQILCGICCADTPLGPSGITTMAEGKGQQACAVQGRQLSRWWQRK